MSAEAKNLERIVQSIERHNATCPFPAVAVRMNPHEVERLGWDSINGLPIEGDPKLGTGVFEVVCQNDPDGEATEAVANRELQPA